MQLTVKVGDDHFYRVQFRKIKRPTVEFIPGQMILILPNESGPEESVRVHSKWIGRMHATVLGAMRLARSKSAKKRPQAEFRSLVWKLADEYSNELDVEFYKIHFKKMEEKWASCGTDGNLTFNTLMRDLPERLIAYVTFHEVAHRREMNHGKNFQKIMRDKFPDKDSIDMELYVHWLIVNKITQGG